MSEKTTIAVKREVKNNLKKMGRKGDTYSDIIEKLVKLAKKEKFHERQKKILEEGEFVDLDEI